VQTPGDALATSLIQARFDQWVATWPGQATRFGLHQHDGQLPDLSRSAKLADIEADHVFLRQLEAIDAAALSPAVAFERDVALHSARLRLFEAEAVRNWERTVDAAEEIGGALFTLAARDFAPLVERLRPMTSRIEGIPAALEQVRDRLGGDPVRLWLELESGTAAELPGMLHEIRAGAASVWAAGSPELARLDDAVRAAEAALLEYAAWCRTRAEGAGERLALGRHELDRLVALRALDGLTTDDILAIGWDQLEVQHEARREAGRQIDPSLSEDEVVARVKADGPADFEAALEGYREAMFRARQHIAAHDLATLPTDDVLEVMATPRHMRNLLPLAAYFDPAAFDRPPRGTYVVTPSVDDGPGAMNEHNWASMVNTSVHEAYPGHHLQLTAALATPTPARLMVEAPEFVEGWGMYCEQMMIDEGFEDSPERRVIVATDAIWRAARIILDIRLHRGEISIEEGVEFLVAHTGFERPVAESEVRRYTTVPGYNLSYLLGKVLLLRLRADEQARLGADYSLKGFHDALLYSGSLPISFHRRLLAGEGGGPTPAPAGAIVA
jgi:uncharacterized protein (DUF885 family)